MIKVRKGELVDKTLLLQLESETHPEDFYVFECLKSNILRATTKYCILICSVFELNLNQTHARSLDSQSDVIRQGSDSGTESYDSSL